MCPNAGSRRHLHRHAPAGLPAGAEAVLHGRAAARVGTRTRYTAIALNADAEGRKNREEMSFCEGWNTAIDRMVHFVKRQ
ncbi:hypothetical protein BOQ54_04070 [Chelatococcus daeguensis]|uniref:Uncharacterized protein n=1 Tax=Chelatococcus daeguensis TaxID=444444 RepID=A0AAC9JSX6_9HYPH|nr:hypothetical protein BOQ54_04070 [Chelatococcus daeguensis]